MINSSLNNLAKTMLNKDKLDIGVKTSNNKGLLIEGFMEGKPWDDYISDLARDCTLLLDILHKLANIFLEEYNFILGSKSTISSTAVDVYFYNYYYPDEQCTGYIKESLSRYSGNLFYSLTFYQDVFIREAFIGGRNEVFEPFLSGVDCYDLNSAYCSAIEDKPMQTGKSIAPYKIKDPVEFVQFELCNDNEAYAFLEFVEATVCSPPHLDSPTFAVSYRSGASFFSNVCFTGKFFSEELKYGIKLEYEVQPHGAVKVASANKSHTLFCNFMDEYLFKTYSLSQKRPQKPVF